MWHQLIEIFADHPDSAMSRSDIEDILAERIGPANVASKAGVLRRLQQLRDRGIIVRDTGRKRGKMYTLYRLRKDGEPWDVFVKRPLERPRIRWSAVDNGRRETKRSVKT